MGKLWTAKAVTCASWTARSRNREDHFTYYYFMRVWDLDCDSELRTGVEGVWKKESAEEIFEKGHDKCMEKFTPTETFRDI
jgi:hypothetical protein